jgi:hypothetical protein
MSDMIYAGQAYDWTDFGPGFSVGGGAVDASITACLRHAGSGTHAAFDYAVMNRGLWASPMVVFETPYIAGLSPWVWFNDATDDLLKCVNGNDPGHSTGQAMGGIGYADADKGVGTSGVSNRVKKIKYNGQFGTHNTVANGSYDFFSNQTLYENPGKAGNPHSLIVDMVNYSSNPAKMLGSKKAYWATSTEMKFNKSSEHLYPTRR